MQTIPPFLWFNDQAQDAMNFYTGIFMQMDKLYIERLQQAHRQA